MAAELELSILLSEKKHAEQVIRDYLGLQLKIFAFFSGAAGAVLALFFSKDAGTGQVDPAVAASIVASAGCLVLLQSMATYGIALGYIHYRQVAIMPRLRELAQMSQHSINAVVEFSRGPAALPVSFATGVLVMAHFLCTASLLGFAAFHTRGSWPSILVVALTSLLLIFTCATEGILLSAMKKVRERQLSGA
jgi:hypothetical protein